ncbi:MAG: hypothetical protein GF350_02715, partial [Chitinivibrionales bacterium]|nr:hypothetical protein [Chitinivibrionales bacterium]
MNPLFKPDTKKIVLSPHYDDLALSLGGLALHWAGKECPVENIVVFSNSNCISTEYQAFNQDYPRSVEAISVLRHKEECAVAEHLGNITVKRSGLDEAPLRGHGELTGIHALSRRK